MICVSFCNAIDEQQRKGSAALAGSNSIFKACSGCGIIEEDRSLKITYTAGTST